MSHNALVGRALTLLRQDDPEAALERLGWWVGWGGAGAVFFLDEDFGSRDVMVFFCIDIFRSICNYIHIYIVYI